MLSMPASCSSLSQDWNDSESRPAGDRSTGLTGAEPCPEVPIIFPVPSQCVSVLCAIRPSRRCSGCNAVLCTVRRQLYFEVLIVFHTKSRSNRKQQQSQHAVVSSVPVWFHFFTSRFLKPEDPTVLYMGDEYEVYW